MKDHIKQFYCGNTEWLERSLIENSKNTLILAKTPKDRQKNLSEYTYKIQIKPTKISDIILSFTSLGKGVTSIAFRLVLDIFTKLKIVL